MFVSVIPALKMPFGHELFDYQILEGTVHVGDLIMVPFRNRLMPALVAKISPTSQYAEKAIALPQADKVLKFPEAIVDFCLATARECFVSPATILHAWLRVVPKRLDLDHEPHTFFRAGRRPADAKALDERYLVNRYAPPDGIMGAAQAEQPNGRVLIITPWQSRVQYLQQKLGCPGFHALTAAGAAWRTWNGFLEDPHAMLVTTRVGAWLAIGADVVILDEPENDDYKQDELTPRYDARRLSSLAQESNPALRIIRIGTTPPLASDTPAAPAIEIDLQTEALVPGSRSKLESICPLAYLAIEQAVADNRPVRILHPIGGARGRIRCADCGWVMTCPKCGYGLNNLGQEAGCRRCGFRGPIAMSCPQCQSADLNKSMIGLDLLQEKVSQAFPAADVKVLDLQAWPGQSLRPESLVIITNLNFIGGYTEDIRRKERLIIAFRRLAAQVSLARCRLIVQGPETLTNECLTWLTPEGLQIAWGREMTDRRQFGFPPARLLAKLIVTAKPEDADKYSVDIRSALPEDGWEMQGPYQVEHRSSDRSPRLVYHILPPQGLERSQIIDILTPLASLGILDLDPIAFFS